MITARITKIDKVKSGTDGDLFLRVYFQTLPEKKWVKTDVCMGFRNFARWKYCLKVGNVLADLQLKNDKTVDADSYPRFLRYEQPAPDPPAQMQFPI